MVNQRSAWRKEQIEALGGKCEQCGSTDKLTVHHKDGNFTNNAPENLELLCDKHHKKVRVVTMSSKYDVPKINELQQKILLRSLRYYILRLVEQLKEERPITRHSPASEYLEDCMTLYKRLRDKKKGKPQRFWWMTNYDGRLFEIERELWRDMKADEEEMKIGEKANN